MAVIAPDDAHAKMLRSYVDAVKSGKPANRVAVPQGLRQQNEWMQRTFGPGGPSKLSIKAIVSVIRLRAELEKADTKAMSAATQPNEAEEERTAIAAHARATGVTVENSQYQHIRRQPSLPYQWKHYYKVRKWEWISDPCSRTLNWISSRMIYRNWRHEKQNLPGWWLSQQHQPFLKQ